MKKIRNFVLVRRGRNFIARISDSSILHAVTERSISEEVENLGLRKPEATKYLIDEALKNKGISKIPVDIESEAFRKEVNKHVIIKNIKQKLAFLAGSIPMFKTLNAISVKTALNPLAQLPLDLKTYFGISMPGFIALHIAEHILPPSPQRSTIKITKIIVGVPFCVISECVDQVSSVALKVLKLPNPSLDMEGTIGVPSDLKIQDVLHDMQQWDKENSEIIDGLNKLYNIQRDKKHGSK